MTLCQLEKSKRWCPDNVPGHHIAGPQTVDPHEAVLTNLYNYHAQCTYKNDIGVSCWIMIIIKKFCTVIAFVGIALIFIAQRSRFEIELHLKRSNVHNTVAIVLTQQTNQKHWWNYFRKIGKRVWLSTVWRLTYCLLAGNDWTTTNNPDRNSQCELQPEPDPWGPGNTSMAYWPHHRLPFDFDWCKWNCRLVARCWDAGRLQVRTALMMSDGAVQRPKTDPVIQNTDKACTRNFPTSATHLIHQC